MTKHQVKSAPAKTTPVAKEPRPNQLVVNRQELAWLLGVSYDWVVVNIDKMMRERGFPSPRPLPGQNRWSYKQVRAWIDGEEARRESETAPAATPKFDYDAELDRRNREIAGGASGKSAA